LRLEPQLRGADTIGWEEDVDRLDMSSEAVAAIRCSSAIELLGEAWSNVLANRSRVAYSGKISPIFVPSADAVETMRAIIQLSRQFRNSIPTVSGARLWRLASEWAADTDPITFGYFSAALPSIFSPGYKIGTYTDVQIAELLSLDFSHETVEREWLGGHGVYPERHTQSRTNRLAMKARAAGTMLGRVASVTNLTKCKRRQSEGDGNSSMRVMEK
jgi:hypothetical protein